jgi:hypothetical protein
MPDRKRFGLQSPRELLAKLDWELAQFDRPVACSEQISSYRAFNCAVTAWSLCDWVWNAASGETKAAIRVVSPKPTANGSEVLAAFLRLESRELAYANSLQTVQSTSFATSTMIQTWHRCACQELRSLGRRMDESSVSLLALVSLSKTAQRCIRISAYLAVLKTIGTSSLIASRFDS